MCGLAAVLDWEKGGWGSEDQAYDGVYRALEAMAHRGHSEAQPKVLIVGKTVLGHIRLPIIDLDPRSDQPMIVGDTVGVFVGEVFNFKSIDFEAYSDTEVFIRVFRHQGVQGFHQFDGFWSAVLVRDKEPTVVTDYLSQKPLYFHERSLFVASEPAGAVAALNLLPQNLDKVYFSNVLKWGYDPTGRTPYAGLVQLPAGSVLTIGQGLKVASYWDWQRVPAAPNLRDALTQATCNRLIGDRPVSLLLSGGLDSTIILGILTKVLYRSDIRVLHTSNDEDQYLEAALAMCLPNMRISGRDPGRVNLEQALVAHQVPVDLGSMIPQTDLAQSVKRLGFYVCLSGDGADELFGGYRRAKEYDSQASDVFMELPYYHLPRLDRIMMRSTVELRSPYLAPQVIKYALSLPWKARTEKQALKDTFSDLVPSSILNRPKFPLKSPEVIHGGVQWRQTVIEQWEKIHVS